MTFWSRHVSARPTEAGVAIDKGEWIDSARQGRAVPYKIYRPLDISGGPFPVVVWSHGLGGSRDGAGFISRYLASYGYVVVHIQHEGTDSGLWEGKPGHPWDVIRAARIPRKATLQRFRDVPFALCELEKMAAENAALAGVMDLSRLGMSGHSFGALTTQIMAGQRRGRGARLYSLHEPKFRAGILYSPVPQRNKKGESAETLYGSIKIPLLVMTGTNDDSPLEKSGYEDRLEVFEHSGGPEQHLLILEDGDHMVYSGSRGQLGKNPKRDIHEEIICVLSLAFWEAYLKGDNAAKHWLSGGGVDGFLREEARYTYRP
jgi:dienelactone hydrolase